MESQKKYPIKVVSIKTGLSLHVIRAWEKRYNVVEPERTDSNRRLYSDSDVYRLELLKKATDVGYSIGSIAELPLSNLEELAGNQSVVEREEDNNNESNQSYSDPKAHYDRCMEAIYVFDSVQLESSLIQASVSLTQPILIESLIMPLVKKVGELWRQGSLRIMHEHMTTAVLKTFLTNLRNAYRPTQHAPTVIVTTPMGQLHEVGALIIALVAAAEGWQVIYLGPNLPAEEIVAASVQKNAKAVVLSIVYPADDPFLYQELEKLRNFLPGNIDILIGGRAANNYKSMLTKISAWSSNDLSDFRDHLEQIENR